MVAIDYDFVPETIHFLQLDQPYPLPALGHEASNTVS